MLNIKLLPYRIWLWSKRTLLGRPPSQCKIVTRKIERPCSYVESMEKDNHKCPSCGSAYGSELWIEAQKVEIERRERDLNTAVERIKELENLLYGPLPDRS